MLIVRLVHSQMIGTAALIPAFLLLGLTSLLPIPMVAVLGCSFSLVPSALWPCIPLIVAPRFVGTAFGLTTAFQNVGTCCGLARCTQQRSCARENAGLFVVPLIVGYTHTLLRTYTVGILLFALLALVGFDFSFFLRYTIHYRLLELPSAATGGVELPPRDPTSSPKYVSLEMEELGVHHDDEDATVVELEHDIDA